MAQSSHTLLSGVLEERDGRYYLTSGGLTAELAVGSAAQNLSAFVGQTVSFRGRQTAARIEQAQLLPPSETAKAATAAEHSRFAPVFATIDVKGAVLGRLALAATDKRRTQQRHYSRRSVDGCRQSELVERWDTDQSRRQPHFR
jgi:hypothetical protein